MGAKHTPGPWETARTHAANGGYEIQAEGCPGQHIASAMAGSGGVDGTLTANARLIAAAPELLEVLELLLTAVENDCRGDCFDDDWCHKCGIGEFRARAKAAIAKAKGEG